jgi:2-C-methyl-D-erythritol 4-phosphate cytidylyltransferase
MNVAIIAAAGQGTRIGGKRAKQFVELAGTPIIVHTLKPFEQCEVIQEIILVLPEQDTVGFLEIGRKYGLRKLAKIVPGGTTRAESVLRGLEAISSQTTEIVAIHDGVRPFVTADEITQTVRTAEINEAAILVAPATDTIKQVKDGTIVRTLQRADLRHALTPQCFRYSLLKRAFQHVDVLNPDLTDESLLVEQLGVKVAIVEGSSRNIKITRPEDLAMAEIMFKDRQ